MNRFFLFSIMSLPYCVSFAGGLISYEIGTPDLGLASAGYAARAQDAATVMTNPAGMARLAHTEIMLGIQPLYGRLIFSPNAQTTVTGDDGGNAVSWFPGGGGFLVYNVSDNFKLGVSSYGNFGLPLHYNGSWVGRYYATEATLLGMTISPSMAYRIHEMWSLGLSFNAMYGILSQKAAVNNSPLGLFGVAPDGELRVKNTTWGYGLTFGFLFEPTECTRFGLTYTTETDLNFETAVEFTDVFPAIIPGGSFDLPLNLGMTVPRQVMFSLYHQWTDCLAILGNLGWQNWEQFGRVDVMVGTPNPTSLVDDLNYNDTWHYALGIQYTLTPAWRLSFGTAYDSSMTENSKQSVAVPISTAWRLGLGLQYFVCDDFNVGAGYTRLVGGNINIDQYRGILAGRVAGAFDNSVVNYFGINVDWKF